MLRRPPTTIRLTSEDILAYDDRNLRKQQRQQNENENSSTKQKTDSNTNATLTRDQRIGIKR